MRLRRWPPLQDIHSALAYQVSSVGRAIGIPGEAGCLLLGRLLASLFPRISWLDIHVQLHSAMVDVHGAFFQAKCKRGF